MASSIVKSAAQQLGNLVVEEAKYLYDVRDKIESLQMELAWMECFLRDADNQQHQEKVVCMWVSHVRDLAYDAEDIVQRYLHGVRHHRHDGVRNTLKWFSSTLCTGDAWTLHNLGSEIDNLTFKMSELTSRLQRYGIQIIKTNRSMEYNTMLREERRTYSHTEEDVVGLETDIQQVVDRLLKKTEVVKVVGISGIGGLGKTTLARKVYKHKDIKDHFNDNCAWVYISKEFDNKTIFQEILRQLEKGNDANRREEQFPPKEKTVEQLAEEIHKVLQGKRCLVVVDDIWTVRAWERLKPAFEAIFTTASTSSKILLTTRNQDLLKHVDPSGYLHLLKTLSDGDSWKLLKRKAFIGDDDDRMKKLGEEMLKHCGGLPIAIIAIGGVLSTKKTLSEWEDVRTNISSYLMGRMEQEGTNNRLLEILELSYNELPFYLKPCFLYLGNFPEDYEISTQKLYHLWEAEGFLVVEGEVKKKGGTSYDIGETYLNELVQRSMVLVRKRWPSGRIKICQVHDVMRDMCLRKCEEVSFLSHIASTESGMVYGLPPFSTEIQKLRRCALVGEDEVEHWQFGEKAIGLRSLLVFNKRFTPARKIWKSCPLLRVLDVEGVEYFRGFDGMKCLIHLRYLSLKGSRMEEIPSWLFDLQYMETLDLRQVNSWGMDVFMLSNEFYKMKRLRHLYLPKEIFKVKGGKKLRFPIGGQMETIKNFDPSSCETKELIQMTNLRVFSIRWDYICGKAEELKGVLEAPVLMNKGQLINTFRIGIHEDVILENPLILRPAESNPSFKELRIEGTGKHVKKDDSIIFPDSLTRAVLFKCENIEDLILDLEKLPPLQVLHLYSSTIGEAMNKMSFSPRRFPQLREFRVQDPLRSFEWEVGDAAAPNLQLLELWECENLNNLKNIPNSLTEVKLRVCRVTEGEVSALEKLPHLKSLDVGELVDIKLLSFSAGSFPQLTELCLEGPTELEEWKVGEGALANLRSLNLMGWKRLKKVVMIQLPDSLTQVELVDCDIIGEGDVSLLACLEKLPHLQKLTIDDLVKSGGGNKLSFSHGSFPRLAELELTWHPRLMEWEIGDGALPNLQQLNLNQCKKLNKLNNLPNNLTRVVLGLCGIGGVLLMALENLPRLQQLYISDPEEQEEWKWEVGDGAFPTLQHLELCWCDKLKQLEVGDGALPNLQRLVLNWCEKLKQLEVGDGALPNLQCLVLNRCYNLKQLEVGDGAFPTLQRLELYKCDKLKKRPKGLPDSVHIVS